MRRGPKVVDIVVVVGSSGVIVVVVGFDAKQEKYIRVVDF